MIIEPVEPDPARRVVDAFVDSGLSLADAEALADVVATEGLIPHLNDDSPDHDPLATLEVIAKRLAQELRDPARRDIAIAREVSGLLGFGPMYPPWINDPSAQPAAGTTIAAVLECARSRLGLDCDRAINEGLLADPCINTKGLLFALVVHRAVRPERILDLNRIRAASGRGQWVANLNREETASALNRLFDAFREKAFDLLLPLLIAEPDDSVAQVASGLLNRFSSWFMQDGGTVAEHGFSGKWYAIADSFAGFAEHLHTRWVSRPHDVMLEQMLWRYGWRAFGHEPERCPEPLRSDLVRTARDALGRLRQPLAQPQELTASDAVIAERMWRLEDACLVVGLFDGMWNLLRPLALALRALRTPCVSSDLRYWSEPQREEPPKLWRRIPEQFVGAVHLLARREQDHDDTLLDVRSKFARFLLERLTTRSKKAVSQGSGAVRTQPTDAGPIEPSATWRMCSIRAALELHVNPEGRGHHVLHHAAELDPDPEVRALARSAYARLRNSPKLPDVVSPRRALLAAFWWLRQAHLIELGIPIDARGAQRTLQKEVRYTTRADD